MLQKRDKAYLVTPFLGFVFPLNRSDNELLVSKMPPKFGVTDFASEIKNYPDLEKLAHVI